MYHAALLVVIKCQSS